MSTLAPVNTDECIELILKYNIYKSFKIGLNENLMSTVLSADFWPASP